MSKYLDKIKETASELQKIIKSFAGKNGVPRKTKEYGLANVKSTYDEQTKTNTEDIIVELSDISLYKLCAISTVVCTMKHGDKREQQAFNHLKNHLTKLVGFLVDITELPRRIKNQSINTLDNICEKVQAISISTKKPGESDLERQLQLALEEITYQQSILHSESIVTEQKCKIMMFSQAKIGQILREIEEKTGCRSDTPSGKDKEILDLIEHAPLLRQERVKTIESRNKGIAHEILNFDETRMRETIKRESGHIKSCIEAIICIRRFSQPILLFISNECMDAFLQSYQDIINAETCLGRKKQAIDHINDALTTIEKCQKDQDTLSNHHGEIISRGKLFLINEIGKFCTYEHDNQRGLHLSKNYLDQLEAKLNSIKESHMDTIRVKFNIGNLHMFAKQYDRAICCLQTCIDKLAEFRSIQSLEKECREIQQSSWINIAKAYIYQFERNEAESAIEKVNYVDIESAITQFDYLCTQCTILFRKGNLGSFEQKLKEANQLLETNFGSLKADYGSQDYLSKKVSLLKLAIPGLKTKADLHEFRSRSNLATIGSIKTALGLLEDVGWIYENGHTLQIIADTDLVITLINTSIYLINFALINNELNNNIQEKSKIMENMMINLLKVKQQYNLQTPLALVYYCVGLCYAKNSKVALSTKLEKIKDAITETEKHLVTVIKAKIGDELLEDQKKNEISRCHTIINTCIRKIRWLYKEQQGPSEGMVGTFNCLKQIALSSLQSQDKYTFNTLKKLAKISHGFDKLQYRMDMSVVNMDPEAVELIKENGGDISDRDESTQALLFSMSPQNLTSQLLTRLGLQRTAIANTSEYTTVSSGSKSYRIALQVSR